MRNFLILFLLLATISVSGQGQKVDRTKFYRNEKAKDSTTTEHKKTVYHLLQRAWVANLEPSYAAPGSYVSNVKDRRIPLRDGEGAQSSFNVLEANLNFSFPLFFGREIGRQRQNKETGEYYWSDVNRRHRVSFEYNGNFRMTLDDSKPIIPSSHKVGLTWHVNLHNNYTGWVWDDKNEQAAIESSEDDLHFTTLLIRAHHYSNGQPAGFFFPNDSVPAIERRNDYQSGDFSTNYFQFELTHGWYDKSNRGLTKTNLHQFSLGYRVDLGTEESIFAFSEQQEDAYGRNRLSASYDYRSGRFNKKSDYHFRVEAGYIIDNLDNFLPNIENDTGKYRFSIRGLVELSPKSHRAVGYYVSLFYGRDYLNIRYDDIVVVAQAGFTVSLDKFFMPSMSFKD